LVQRAKERGDRLRVLASVNAQTRKAALAQHPSLRPAVDRLSARYGPNVWTADTQTAESAFFAHKLVLDALPALRSAGPTATAQGWRLHPPALETLPPQDSWGVPLLAACTSEDDPNNALDELAHLVDILGDPQADVLHDNTRVRLAEAIQVETELWQAAADHGGLSPRIPYAYHFLALERFWTPQAHARNLQAPATCLRCGTIWWPSRSITAPPRCAHCNNENPMTRAWPAHAIAPDIRGHWWLRCQYKGCDNAFVGYRNRRHCAAHISSHLPRQQRKTKPPTP
jgi:hypothetical protein